jgi:(4S)-4-hydroxy-5-phosphonooxypentane-2,3-dione isomerase
MIVTFVHVWVIPGKADEFIEACKTNHLKSVKEPGNLRFDILRDAGDPNKFTLYEAYVSEEASRAHKDTVHYLEWKSKVADWMARPREGIKHEIICPEDPAKW